MDRPIIFSAPMVRALLDGRKTQTRRVLKAQPPEWATFCEQPSMLNVLHQWVPSGLWRWSELEQSPPRPLRQWPIDEVGSHYWLRLPYAVRDRLWVREAWAPLDALTHNDPGTRALIDRGFYRADEGTVDGEIARWRPSIHMPRWASRLTLAVTDVRVERLQDISEADARAEGVEPLETEREGHDWSICPKCGGTHLHGALGHNLGYCEVDCCECDTHAKRFRHLWNSINGPDAWDANPWVAAISFTVHRANIDALDIGAAA